MSSGTALVALGGFGGLAAVITAIVAMIRLPSDRGTAAVTQAQGANVSLKNAADSWEALTKSAELRAAELRLELREALTRTRQLEDALDDCRRGLPPPPATQPPTQ